MLSDMTHFCKLFNIKQFVLIQNVMISFVRHSTSQNIHAIRNVERCNVRLCGISYSNTNQGDWLRRNKCSAQTSSHDTFLSRFSLFCGMTIREFCGQ